MKLAARLLLLLLSAWPSFAQQKLVTPQDTNDRINQLAAAMHVRQGEYVIGSGDVIRIEVFDVPELSRDIRVGESGYLSLPPLAVRVRAMGLTTFQLEEKMAELLQVNGLVSHPQVSVTVKEQRSQPITVIGAVKRPLVYQAVRQTTLLEVISEAGGIADDAGSTVIVTRKKVEAAPGENPNGDAAPAPVPESETITVNLSDLLESGNPQFNIPLLGGDVISVPRAGVVYLVGAIERQGGFVLSNDREEVTALKVIALAGGLKPTAKAKNAVVLRKNPQTGQRQEVNVDLSKVMQRKGEDFPLVANDILFVPDSAGKRALRRTGETALALATGAALFRLGR